MVKLDKIYTRGGDKGLTSLGDGSRVKKVIQGLERTGISTKQTHALVFQWFFHLSKLQ